MRNFEDDSLTGYVPINVGNRRMYVETMALGDEEIAGRAVDVAELTNSLQLVAETITNSLSAGLREVKPGKVTVEFGCEVAMETGTLVAVLVKGTAKANLKVTMEWTPS